MVSESRCQAQLQTVARCTIRPWVRVGAEYLWSRYRREQRFSVLDTKTTPIKAYGNYLMNYHNAKLGLGFNFMELWPRRRAQWLNIWVGTGVGYTFAKGNEYGIYISNTQTQGGQTTPIGEGTTIGNDSEVTITGSIRSTNRHEKFNTLYVPAPHRGRHEPGVQHRTERRDGPALQPQGHRSEAFCLRFGDPALYFRKIKPITN